MKSSDGMTNVKAIFWTNTDNKKRPGSPVRYAESFFFPMIWIP